MIDWIIDMLYNSKSTFCEYRKKAQILLPFSIVAYCYDLHETYQINGSATGSNYKLPQYRRDYLWPFIASEFMVQHVLPYFPKLINFYKMTRKGIQTMRMAQNVTFLNSISKPFIMIKKKGCLLYTHQL